MIKAEEKRQVITVLRRLALTVVNKVSKGLSSGALQPKEELYCCPKVKVKEFRYTDKGIESVPRQITYTIKNSWLPTAVRITESIKKSTEYSEALKLLTKILGKEFRAQVYLEQFVRKLTLQRLTKQKSSKSEIDSFLAIFLKNLNEEPIKYGAHVKLEGIVMQPEKIEFEIAGMTILLRKTKIEDFEEQYPAFRHTLEPFHLVPSAILNIEFFGRSANEITERVEQAVTILRLFKVMSAKYISYDLYSESITDIGASGRLTKLWPEKALEISKITNKEAQKLEEFWKRMIVVLPANLYSHKETQVNHISIAYRRYCDALLLNGTIERRIANSIMGLESLFLKRCERQELKYRLSIRVAKILSLLKVKDKPSKIRQAVRNGYNIRSLFVHGSLSSNKKSDIIYRELLLSIMKYLRVSILTMILTKTFTDKKKEELINLIDDALIEEEKNKKLASFLNKDIQRFC